MMILYLFLLFISTFINILIGSSLYPVLCLFAISVLSIIPILGRAKHISDVIVLSFGFYCGFATLLIKAFYLQPIQDNLVYPNYSATLLLLGFLCIFAANYAARGVVRNRTSRLSRNIDSCKADGTFVYAVISIGLITRAAHIVLTRSGEDVGVSFGGFGSFYHYTLLAIALAFYAIVAGGKSKSTPLIIVSGAIILFSGVSNAKRDIIDLFIIIFLLCLGYQVRLRLFPLILGSSALAILMLIVSPAIHIVRGEDVASIQRALRTFEVMREESFNPYRLANREADYLKVFEYSNAKYSSHIYPHIANVDRFSHIFTMDQTLRGAQAAGYLGGGIFIRKFLESVLPSALMSKDGAASIDVLAWTYGIRHYGSIARPVIGTIPSSYAVAGPVMMIVLLGSISFIMFSCANYLFGVVQARIFGPVGAALLIYTPEKPFEMMLSFVARDALLIWGSITVLLMLRGALRYANSNRPKSDEHAKVMWFKSHNIYRS